VQWIDIAAVDDTFAAAMRLLEGPK
jgi:hypothetical protein